jgi:hypothetical protein
MAFLKFIDNHNTKCSLPLSYNGITYLADKDGILTASENRLEEHQAGFLKSSRGWVILDYTGCHTFVNGVRVADCKLVRQGDTIRIGQASAQLTEEIRKVTVNEGSVWLNPEKLCFYDQNRFEIEDEIVCCPECGVPYHHDCWNEIGEGCLMCQYQKPSVALSEKEK